jgi:peptidoglycan/LPS O-acetylase OafA/YrhL
VLCVELPQPFRVIFDVFVLLLLFPLLIHAGTREEPRGLTAAICDIAGRASYAVYVLQLPVMELTKLVYAKITGHNLADAGILVVLMESAFIILLALILDAIWDAPVRRWLTLRIRPGKSSPPANTKSALASQSAESL